MITIITPGENLLYKKDDSERVYVIREKDINKIEESIWECIKKIYGNRGMNWRKP